MKAAEPFQELTIDLGRANGGAIKFKFRDQSPLTVRRTVQH